MAGILRRGCPMAGKVIVLEDDVPNMELEAAGNLWLYGVISIFSITGATFFNYLTRNSRFFKLTADQQVRFKRDLPIQRTNGEPPSDGAGYWTSDRNYYSGGQGLNRQTFQPAS